MKLTKLLNLLLLGAALTFTITGCKRPQNTKTITKLPEPSIVGPGTLPPGSSVPGGPGSTDVTGGGIPPSPGHPGWAEDTQALKAQTVYFDYDKSAIKASEQSKLDDVAGYLKSNPACAARGKGSGAGGGKEKYNLPLGDPAPPGAGEYLHKKRGITPIRVDIVTNGKDRRGEGAHNGAAGSKNRRDEF